VHFFRVSRNAWGQETLEGVSWDLIWFFIGAAVIFIVAHFLYKWLLAPAEPPARRDDRAATDQEI